jgi:nicotinamidase-related amidase
MSERELTASSTLSVASSPRPWPIVSPVQPNQVALLVIDMQVDFLGTEGWFAACGLDVGRLARIVPNVASLLGAARAAPPVKVVHARQGNRVDLADLPPARRVQRESEGRPHEGLVFGSPGWRHIAAVAPAEHELVIDKQGYSVFEATTLDSWLRGHGVSSLILCGVTANMCVLASLYGAVERGYDCLVVNDAVSSVNASVEGAALELMDYRSPLLCCLAPTSLVIDAFSKLKAASGGQP